MKQDYLLLELNAAAANDPHGSARRHAILERNLELAEHSISVADDDDEVILVLDLENCDLSKGLALRLDGPNRDRHQKLVEDCRKNGTIPNLLLRIPRWTLYKLLRHTQRSMQRLDPRNPAESSIVETLKHPAPSGTFFYMVISQGKQLATMPVR
jgi:hypothetical protein